MLYRGEVARGLKVKLALTCAVATFLHVSSATSWTLYRIPFSWCCTVTHSHHLTLQLKGLLKIAVITCNHICKKVQALDKL